MGDGEQFLLFCSRFPNRIHIQNQTCRLELMQEKLVEGVQRQIE